MGYTKVVIIWITSIFCLQYWVCNALLQGFTIDLPSSAGCISHHEARTILLARKNSIKGQIIPIFKSSIDMQKSFQPIYLLDEGIALSEDTDKLLITWEELSDIADKKVGCHALYDDGSEPWQIKTFSDTTNIAASLCPPLDSPGAPTLLLGGFTMHRISGDNVNPMVDTANKMSAVRINPSHKILDTCMGLGYTAIAAATQVKSSSGGQVLTCEVDTASLEMASYNPWSKPLFDDSLPLSVIHSDVTSILSTDKYVANGELDIIIHDPPAQALCRQDLYSREFYQLLHKKLRKSGGQIFHYIGNPNSRESGRLFRGVIERLTSVGFKNARSFPSAFGVVANT